MPDQQEERVWAEIVPGILASTDIVAAAGEFFRSEPGRALLAAMEAENSQYAVGLVSQLDKTERQEFIGKGRFHGKADAINLLRSLTEPMKALTPTEAGKSGMPIMR